MGPARTSPLENHEQRDQVHLFLLKKRVLANLEPESLRPCWMYEPDDDQELDKIPCCVAGVLRAFINQRPQQPAIYIERVREKQRAQFLHTNL